MKSELVIKVNDRDTQDFVQWTSPRDYATYKSRTLSANACKLIQVTHSNLYFKREPECERDQREPTPRFSKLPSLDINLKNG